MGMMPIVSGDSLIKLGREIARGSERSVHMVEKTPDLLIKVIHPKHLRTIDQTSDKSFLAWLKVRKAYALYLTEQKAWNNVMMRAAIRNASPPLAGIGSLVRTQNGPGIVVERIVDPDGNTAPTLDDLLQVPLNSELLKALNDFVAALYEWHIPVYDLGPKNIVLTATGRFVLVDGFGERSFLPLKTWFRWLNNRRLDSAFAKTARKCPLIWNAFSRSFEPAVDRDG